MKVSVFGSGAWGTAIALVLHDNGHEVTLWSKFEEEAAVIRDARENPLLKGVSIPKDIAVTSQLDEATAEAGVAVIAVPSFALRETTEALKGELSADCLVICVSKGIEKDASALFTDIITGILGAGARIASISGPTHAEEVALRIPSACVAASRDPGVAQQVQELFMNERFRVYTSTDVIGVELGAALKNVIAISAGICDGLGYGDNTIAMLMTRGLAEMARLCVAMGGHKETLAGLAGLGDLIVTCGSRHSRNRRAGVLIGKGMPAVEAMREVGAVVEGYYAAKAARELSAKTGVSMPICEEAYNVLYEGKDPVEAMAQLMGRSGKSEQSGGEGAWVM
ncbi:MAG: NAD(P)-dependent glycerol-3-phosphate dehydrogenase [Oscillospiraceae bacterium]|nr:NAD(P)-dependent glycerol-3-phosphate dehydrogenase [Oscillospiraceae bacterium]